MIDAHLHLQQFTGRGAPESLMARLRSDGVQVLGVNGTSPEDWRDVATLADRFPEVVPFFGLHPWQLNEASNGWLDLLSDYISRFPQAGVGEIGLDRWVRNHDLPKQREALTQQLAIAESCSRPVTIHCLKAWGTLQACLEESPLSQPFLLHSYGGPKELMRWFSERGAYFSVSGYFFREEKREKLELLTAVPMDRILIETDAPDMLPPEDMIHEVMDNGRNSPRNLSAIYQAYAAFRGIELQCLIDQTQQNFANFTRSLPLGG